MSPFLLITGLILSGPAQEPVTLLRDLVPLSAGTLIVTSPKLQRFYLVRDVTTSPHLDVFGPDGRRVRKTPLKDSKRLLGTDANGLPVFEGSPQAATFEDDAAIRLEIRGDPKAHTETESFDGEFADGVLLQSLSDEAVLSWRPQGAGFRRLTIKPGGWSWRNAWNVSPDLSRFAILASQESKVGTVDLGSPAPEVEWTTLHKADGTLFGEARFRDFCVLNRQVAVALVPADDFDHSPRTIPKGTIGPDAYNETETWDFVLAKITLDSGLVVPLQRFKLTIWGTRMITLGPRGLIVLSDHQAFRILRVNGID